MGKMVIPKNSASIEEVMGAMQIYYDANDWLSNADYIQAFKIESALLVTMEILPLTPSAPKLEPTTVLLSGKISIKSHLPAGLQLAANSFSSITMPTTQMLSTKTSCVL